MSRFRAAVVQLLTLTLVLGGSTAASAAVETAAKKTIVTKIEAKDGAAKLTRKPSRSVLPAAEAAPYMVRQAEAASREVRSGQVLTADTTTTCRIRPFASKKYGYVIDHMNYCSSTSYVLTVLECVDGRCVPVGTGSFSLIISGNGTNNARSISLTGLTYDWKFTGRAAEFPLNIGIWCFARDNARCKYATPSSYTRVAGQWPKSPAFGIKLVSPSDKDDGRDRIAKYDFILGLNYGATAPYYRSLNSFRCDSAGYRPGDRGCVFHKVIENFDALSRNDQSVNENARHVFDALYNPERTRPRFAGKNMPGAPGGTPLRFNFYNQESKRLAKKTITAACDRFFPKRVKKGPGRQQCDEYPFKSTMEAAGSNGKNYSVKAISGPDNEAGGGKLVGFYNRQRMLHGDRYYVSVE